MEVIAISKQVRISPRKVRLVVDSVKKMPLNDALSTLTIVRKRAAVAVAKTLQSAVANAVNNAKLERGTLFIKRIDVSEGSAFKRYHASTRGRIHPYKKRTSTIRVVLDQKGGKEIVESKKSQTISQ